MAAEDFPRLNETLDQVERTFKKLAQQEDLAQAFIECWRWDIPSIYIRWNDSDAIQKNITAYIRASNPHEQLALEVNAWRDQDKDSVRIRHWRHDDRGSLAL